MISNAERWNWIRKHLSGSAPRATGRTAVPPHKHALTSGFAPLALLGLKSLCLPRCEHFHVYALGLRSHGNSANAPGALYSVAEHVLDLSALLDVIDDFPVTLISHSLGGVITMVYSGVYPDGVRKAITIVGLDFPPNHNFHRDPPDRLRGWIETIRKTEQRDPRSYRTLDEAVCRMKEANPHLSDQIWYAND